MNQEPAPGSWLPTSIADAVLRFQGDQVELRVLLRCHMAAASASGQPLVLRLLADEELLAEWQPALLQPDAGGLASVNATLALNPPAGQQARKLALELLSVQSDGTARLHDRWRFALPRRFVQPSLEGAVRLQLASAMPSLQVETIANPRAAGSLSGTLALEIWSLDSPYRGGCFRGKPLGSVTLGSLAGQQRWSSLSQTWHLPVLLQGQRPSGHLTLMLREWTPAGYLTRDWRALEWLRHPAGPAISINRSSTAALRALPGVSDKLARTIVASRPFASIDGLRRARGMTARLHARLRDLVTI